MNTLSKIYWRIHNYFWPPEVVPMLQGRPVKDLIAEIDWEDVPILRQIGESNEPLFPYRRIVWREEAEDE